MINFLKKYKNLIQLSNIKCRAFLVQRRIKILDSIGAIGAEPLKQVFLGYGYKSKYIIRLGKLLNRARVNRYREVFVKSRSIRCRPKARSRLQ